MILSKLDEPTLQKVALMTDGRYVRSVTGDVDLEQIYMHGIKEKTQDRELGSTRRKHWEARYQWFLGLALFFLLFETWLPETTSRNTREVPHA